MLALNELQCENLCIQRVMHYLADVFVHFKQTHIFSLTTKFPPSYLASNSLILDKEPGVETGYTLCVSRHYRKTCFVIPKWLWASLSKQTMLFSPSRKVRESLADVISLHGLLTNQILLFHLRHTARKE